MDFELPRQDEGGQEYQDTLIVDEVLVIHQEKCGGGNQADRNRAQPKEGSLYILVILEFRKEIRNRQDQEERRKADGKGRQAGTEDGHGRGIAGIVNRGVADIGRTVDTDGAGRHLRNRHDVGKLLERNPAVAVHDIGLDERKHRVSPTKPQDTNLQIDVKQL